MKIGISLISAVVLFGISASPTFAKTAKECTAEWRADKAGMQARGVTEKAYVELCKDGATPAAAAPSARSVETARPSAPRQVTGTGSKTVKKCIAEWRADKAGMQARGVTQKAYVEQCRTGSAPAASAPAPRPRAATPSATPSPSKTTSTSQKTAKECIAEWRADKAGQARGVTEKVYVEQRRTGGAVPTATAPEPKPTPASPPPSQPAPTATQAAPAPGPQKPTPTTTAAPAPAPAPPPAPQISAPKDQATLEAG